MKLWNLLKYSKFNIFPSDFFLTIYNSSALEFSSALRHIIRNKQINTNCFFFQEINPSIAFFS